MLPDRLVNHDSVISKEADTETGTPPFERGGVHIGVEAVVLRGAEQHEQPEPDDDDEGCGEQHWGEPGCGVEELGHRSPLHAYAVRSSAGTWSALFSGLWHGVACATGRRLLRDELEALRAQGERAAEVGIGLRGESGNPTRRTARLLWGVPTGRTVCRSGLSPPTLTGTGDCRTLPVVGNIVRA